MTAHAELLALALDVLIHGTRADPPDRFGRTVAAAAAHLGADGAEIYLQDYSQRDLVHLDGQHALAIDTSDAGQAFVLNETVSGGEGDCVRTWLPLRSGGDRLGVLGLLFHTVDAETRRSAERFASVVAEMVVSRSRVADAFSRARRTDEMELAAEMQWGLLPPLTFTTSGLRLAGIVEPAYSVGGDAFDYAFDGKLRFGMFDALGHGVDAAMTAGVAVSAFRHARRRMDRLVEIVAAVDEAVASYCSDGFATGVIGDHDPATGTVRWINAGHPRPRLFRNGVLTDVRHGEPTLPLGMNALLPGAAPDVCTIELVPGDILLLCTDGGLEQRDRAGNPFGDDRLLALFAKYIEAGLPLEEGLRRVIAELLDHAAGRLDDDATILLIAHDG